MNNQILQETIREWHSKTPDSVHGVGWGYKTTNGITTDELCLVFAVVSKKPLAELMQEEILPTTLIVDNETVKTDVVESELAQALSTCHAATDSSSSSHRVSHRPLMGGISISHKEAGATAGTLGGMFKDKDDGSVVGLTNLHVVCPNVGAYGVYSAERPSVFSVWDIESKKMRQQGFTDGGGGDIGDVKRYLPMTLDAASTATRINYIDAAVIGLDSSSLIDANSGSQLGPLSPVNYPVATTAEIDGLLVNGNFLVKSGRTTGYVGSSSACRILVHDMNWIQSVDYLPGIIALHDLIRFTYADFGTNVVVGGDSGSILLADFSGVLKIVGLVFAGGGSVTVPAQVGFACRIDRVMDQLNLEVLGSTTMINASNNWEFIDRIPSAASPTLTENGKKYWECGKLGSGNTKYVTYNLPVPPPPTNSICPAGCNSANYDVFGTPELRVLYNVGTTGGPSAQCTYDQSGNGAEWCSRDAVGSTTIVRRGGSWAVGSGGVSQRHRADQAPHLVSPIVGFRLASSVGGQFGENGVNSLVPVGAWGNTNDTRDSQDGQYYGSVDYLYYIGPYEVTNGEYCVFLTFVGNLPYGVGSCRDDVFSLYNATVGTVANNGIVRSGTSGAYTYAPTTHYSNRPVTFVSWLNCARYVNWLHNGGGGGSLAGDTETGAYSLNGVAVPTIVPNKEPGAIFWIPLENEWYKAAYYKGGSTTAGYWRYPTQSDNVPTEVVDTLSNGDGVVPADCVGTSYPNAPGICIESPNRVIVIQICNNNGIQDDNFDLSLNGTNIGNVDLNSTNRAGVILIGSANTSLYLGENPFQCDITGMPVIYFDPTLLVYGGSPVPLQNNLTMTTTQDNAFCSHGIVQIRSFLAVGSELTENCYIRRDDYRGCDNDPIEILWMFSSVGVGNAEKVICCPDTEGEADCCAGPVPPPVPPCAVVCPPGYVLDPASCLCAPIPMCAECELVTLPDLRPEVKGYIYYVESSRTVFVPEIGDVITSCNGGHYCCRTEFNPILQFTSSKVDANKHANVNNIRCGPARVPPVGWPVSGPDGWPVSGPKYDVADTFEFTAVDWTDIANCEIQLECKYAGVCHDGIAFVVLVGYTLDAGTPIIIFKGCLKANESALITHGVKIGTICSGNEKPCIINLCSPECNYANADEGVGSETNVGTNGGPSAYCTFDQGGNVGEWTDGDGLVQRATTRIFGGDWHQGTEVLKSDYSWPAVSPETHDDYTGFRLCSSIDLSKLTVSHFVFVGDKGNSADTVGLLLGAVLHNYYIQKNEVTNEQYCNFLNSVAKTDTNNLYMSGMNITRIGVSGNYKYYPMLNHRNKPVVHVTYWNAARMANWISNGQPVGVQDATTTEDGAYSIIPLSDIQPVNAINPNTLAAPICFIPTENMWYKAAYYKGGGTNAGYWQYATQYNVAPNLVTSVLPNGDGVVPNPCVPSPSPSPSVSPSPSPSPSPSVSPSPSPSPSPSVCPGCRSTISPYECLDGVGFFDCNAPTGEWVTNCCPCEPCGSTVTCRGGNAGPRLEFTFGNGSVVSKCLSNASLTANGSVPGGLPDGNKLPSPFADPSIAQWTCVNGRYQIYTNLGTCFLTIFMSISHSETSDCTTGDDLNFEITGWQNENGCPYTDSVVSIAGPFYDDCS